MSSGAVLGLANVGDVVAGKYRVDRILGMGGMGMVVQGTHLELEQPVAIKFMLPLALRNSEAIRRFLHEARAAGRLTNEHVCRVKDVGRMESGVPYIVMEYLDGVDLGSLLESQGPLPMVEAVDFLIQACEGMAEAHGQGIVHRDLKPYNLFLHRRSDGTQVIKVLDFGISKTQVAAVTTKPGEIVGSPAYMAPEQMQSSRDVDERADVWSLGVILYQLLSGRMPFVGDSLPSLFLAVVSEPMPSLAEARPDLPPQMIAVVETCLAKRRDDRYRDVLEFAQALAPFGRPESAAAVFRVRSLLAHRYRTSQPHMLMSQQLSDLTTTLPGQGEVRVASTWRPAPSPMRRYVWPAVGVLAACVVGFIVAAVVGRTSGGPHISVPTAEAHAESRPATIPVSNAQPGVEVDTTPPAPTASAAASVADPVAPPAPSLEKPQKPPQKGTLSGPAGTPSGKPATKLSGGPGRKETIASPPPDSPPAPTPAEEDQWGHMHHDVPAGPKPGVAQDVP